MIPDNYVFTFLLKNFLRVFLGLDLHRNLNTLGPHSHRNLETWYLYNSFYQFIFSFIKRKKRKSHVSFQNKNAQNHIPRVLCPDFGNLET